MMLSILIPARNEEFLRRTVEDILAHSEADIEVICVEDGEPFVDLPKDERVKLIRNEKSVGQRAATNQAAEIARGKYVMKVDAHCAFDQGFDRKMLEKMETVDDSVTMVPVMRNLHAFDWVCPDGHRRYQGPSGPCGKCGKETEKQMVWVGKDSPQSTAYCFNTEPKFQYFGEYKKREAYKRDKKKNNLTETMSLQGSCFMMTREKYWELDVCDEAWGSWGSQGIEVACKTWLSGGRVLCNHDTWYAHMFRTQGGDFGFPYPLSGHQVGHAKDTARNLFYDNRWPKQKRPLSWLLERFWPVPGWSEEDLRKMKSWPIQGATAKPRKGVLYYTHNVGNPEVLDAARRQLLNCIKEKHIVSVSSKPIELGRNIVYPRDPKEGFLDIFMKILIGLEAMDCDVVFFAEHDVLYHPKHFDFVPPEKDVFYYNTNVWRVRLEDGHSLYVNDCKQLSGLVAWKDLLLEHYRERIRRIRKEGFTRGNGFEPGTRNVANGGYDNYPAKSYKAALPNLDIRHERNATQNRWSKEQFRNQKYTDGWTESHVSKIPGWFDGQGSGVLTFLDRGVI
jgi:glycosyltransferase involved in cell wall biosynthesis